MYIDTTLTLDFISSNRKISSAPRQKRPAQHESLIWLISLPTLIMSMFTLVGRGRKRPPTIRMCSIKIYCELPHRYARHRLPCLAHRIHCKQCEILCHCWSNSLMFSHVRTVSVDYLSGLALKILQCLVVTVTVVSSAPKASWVVVM